MSHKGVREDETSWRQQVAYFFGQGGASIPGSARPSLDLDTVDTETLRIAARELGIGGAGSACRRKLIKRIKAEVKNGGISEALRKEARFSGNLDSGGSASSSPSYGSQIVDFLMQAGCGTVVFLFSLLLFAPDLLFMLTLMVSDLLGDFAGLLIYGVLFLFIGALYLGFAVLVSYGIRKLTGGNELARIAIVLLTGGLVGGIFDLDLFGDADFLESSGGGENVTTDIASAESASESSSGSEAAESYDEDMNPNLEEVSGYTTEDGKEVDDYIRTKADGVESNNLSYDGGQES